MELVKIQARQVLYYMMNHTDKFTAVSYAAGLRVVNNPAIWQALAHQKLLALCNDRLILSSLGQKLAAELFHQPVVLLDTEATLVEMTLFLATVDAAGETLHPQYLKDTTGTLTTDVDAALMVPASDYRQIKALQQQFGAVAVVQSQWRWTAEAVDQSVNYDDWLA